MPAGTPLSVQNELLKGIETAMKTTNVLNAINQTGLFIEGLKTDAFGKFLANEEQRLRNLMKVEGVSISVE
jgi:tripartite-type tricarboxylate transporter receptor subunit TctC